VVVQLFELLKKQEETRQQELIVKHVEEQRQLAQLEMVRLLCPHHCRPLNFLVMTL
jgi:abortive infection bacteriophage resistance protein